MEHQAEEEKYEWSIGKVIRKLRREQRITQEKLCHGLCSLSAFSRIEAGTRDMDLILEYRLLNRLGYFTDKYELYESPEEFIQMEQRWEMKKLQEKGQWQELENHLREYENQWFSVIQGSTLQRQFVKVLRAALFEEKGELSKAAELLKQAVSLTVPDWEEAWFENGLLAEEELEIFDRLAAVLEKMGEAQKAGEIRRKLFQYLEQSERYPRAMIKLYTGVICRMVPYLLARGEAEEGAAFCEKGLKVLGAQSSLHHWPELLYWKARCLEALSKEGKTDTGEVSEAYQRAYYIYRLFQNETMAETVLLQAGEEYGWEFM